MGEKNSCRKEPKRAEKREEVIKDRLSTAVCIGFVESSRHILKGRNDPSLFSNSYVQNTQLVGRMHEPQIPLGSVSKHSLSDHTDGNTKVSGFLKFLPPKTFNKIFQ